MFLVCVDIILNLETEMYIPVKTDTKERHS